MLWLVLAGSPALLSQGPVTRLADTQTAQASTARESDEVLSSRQRHCEDGAEGLGPA